MTLEIIKKNIEKEGKLTKNCKEKYFQGMNVIQIRDWFESHNLDRHLPIEVESTEIAIKTPFGILMQIRACDNSQLGLWGGVIEDRETPEECAMRELLEECNITVTKDKLKFMETNKHFHEYSNGDKAFFTTYRYLLEYDYVPKITTDEESVGAFMIVGLILDHQKEFVKKILQQ